MVSDLARLHSAEEATAFVCRTMGRILGLDDLVPGDNLFARGARSIDVARVAADILSEYGVQLTLTQVYQNPTPAGLAQIVVDPTGSTREDGGQGRSAPVETSSGRAPHEVDVLLPFQHWYYDLVAPHGISFCLGVRVRHAFGSPERLAAVVKEVVGRHPSLTASYVDHGSTNRVTAGVGRVTWEEFDVAASDDAGILTRATLLADAMDPTTGAMVGVGCPTSSTDWFVLVVHHLAGDATSIDILVDEILTLVRDDNTSLPDATSALAWAQLLNDYATGPGGAAERDYWRALPSPRPNRLRADLNQAADDQRIDTDTLSWRHLDSAARAVGLSPANLLICLLAQAYFELTKDDQVTIGATMSGRDIAIDGATSGRVVGWVAVNVPHVLSAPAEAGPTAIRGLAEQMHAVPSRGAGNQLWEYVDTSDLGDKIRAIRDSAELIVNYMADEPDPAGDLEWLAVQGDKSPLPRRKVLRLAVDREGADAAVLLEWQYDPGLYAVEQIGSLRELLVSSVLALSSAGS